MTRSEVATEALRLRSLGQRQAALWLIKQFKFVSGLQWTPEQIAKMKERGAQSGLAIMRFPERAADRKARR
jgi:hypothetical protein